MSLPRITALVPEGEHFDATALNEGIWFTESHVNNIEAALEVSETNAAAQADQITTLTNQVTEANTARDTVVNDLATANATIESLNQQITTLKGSAAQSFTNTVREGADNVAGANSGNKISSVTAEANKLRVAMGKAPIK